MIGAPRLSNDDFQEMTGQKPTVDFPRVKKRVRLNIDPTGREAGRVSQILDPKAPPLLPVVDLGIRPSSFLARTHFSGDYQ